MEYGRSSPPDLQGGPHIARFLHNLRPYEDVKEQTMMAESARSLVTRFRPTVGFCGPYSLALLDMSGLRGLLLYLQTRHDPCEVPLRPSPRGIVLAISRASRCGGWGGGGGDGSLGGGISYRAVERVGHRGGVKEGGGVSEGGVVSAGIVSAGGGVSTGGSS